LKFGLSSRRDGSEETLDVRGGREILMKVGGSLTKGKDRCATVEVGSI
jgi:hypothetical protein